MQLSYEENNKNFFQIDNLAINGCLPSPDGYGGCGVNANCYNSFNSRFCNCSLGYSRGTSYFDNNETLTGSATSTGCPTGMF